MESNGGIWSCPNGDTPFFLGIPIFNYFSHESPPKTTVPSLFLQNESSFLKRVSLSPLYHLSFTILPLFIIIFVYFLFFIFKGLHVGVHICRNFDFVFDTMSPTIGVDLFSKECREFRQKIALLNRLNS